MTAADGESRRPMSGRTTAEIVADLCRVDGSPTVGTLRREAADRLAELDAENQRLREASKGMSRHIVRKGFENLELDSLRPPCPTCGGMERVGLAYGSTPCPDCVDGKVSIEQLVATYNVVQAIPPHGKWSDKNAHNQLANHLRSVEA